MTTHIVLDFDASVGLVERSQVIPVGMWQERMRFGCGMRTYREFVHVLDRALPASYGTVLFGSGDFHHLSYALIARRQPEKMLTVVVLDNHPDNMRFPFGIHCGSWVRRVAALPWVRHVHVLGITSSDVSAAHAWENYFTPLIRAKLTYWCVGVDVRWAVRLGLRRRFLSFDCTANMIDQFEEAKRGDADPVYLTIDKDVLSPRVVQTNWDQGCMSQSEILRVIGLFRQRLIGSDITGDISTYRYCTKWKRWMSARDKQADVSGSQLVSWQRQQHVVNLRLLDALSACA